MYSLICDKDDADHAHIQSAATQGAEALGYVLSGVLVVSFGWLPGVAAVIAVIIANAPARPGMRLFAKPGKNNFKATAA